MREKGTKNKATIIYNDIKQHVVRDGLRHNAARLDHLKREDPYLFLQVTNKLLKL